MKRPVTLAGHVNRKPKSVEQLRARVCDDPMYSPRADYLRSRPETKEPRREVA